MLVRMLNLRVPRLMGDLSQKNKRWPLIPALGKQWQAALCEFEASLVYRASARTARATQRNPVSKNQKDKIKGRQ